MDVCLLCSLSSVFTEVTGHPLFLHCCGRICLLFQLPLLVVAAQLSYAVAIAYKRSEPDGKMKASGRSMIRDRAIPRV